MPLAIVRVAPFVLHTIQVLVSFKKRYWEFFRENVTSRPVILSRVPWFCVRYAHTLSWRKQ